MTFSSWTTALLLFVSMSSLASAEAVAFRSEWETAIHITYGPDDRGELSRPVLFRPEQVRELDIAVDQPLYLEVKSAGQDEQVIGWLDLSGFGDELLTGEFVLKQFTQQETRYHTRKKYVRESYIVIRHGREVERFTWKPVYFSVPYTVEVQVAVPVFRRFDGEEFEIPSADQTT